MISTESSRSILESVATRIDEARDITRYLANLLIFLGLLGTFYGLATTVPAVVDTIRALAPQENETGLQVFEKLMTGLESQLGGMATATVLGLIFVREGIEYTDRATGEARTFNSATLPKGTVVDGMDVGGYEFSPMFVNESRFKGADFRDIPLLANREVWLRKTVMGPDGQPELDEGGRAVKDTVKVMPAQLKEAVDAGRSRYLAERAEHARQASRAAEHEAPRAQRSVER